MSVVQMERCRKAGVIVTTSTYQTTIGGDKKENGSKAENVIYHSPTNPEPKNAKRKRVKDIERSTMNEE